jgi:hypothetical protein
MCESATGITFVTFIDFHPPPYINPARAARREADAKEIPSDVHFVSDIDSVSLEKPYARLLLSKLGNSSQEETRW